MDNLTLIANSGIQSFTFTIELDMNSRYVKHFREWYDDKANVHKLDLLQKVNTEDGESLYFFKPELYKKGFLAKSADALDSAEIMGEGIKAVNVENDSGFFEMSFRESNRDNKLASLENKWLPIPYFYRRAAKRYEFGSFNWSRFKLIPRAEGVANDNENKKRYNVLLAFDTRVNYENDRYSEMPHFPDKFKNELTFGVCADEVLLMDYCAADSKKCSYIDRYILSLVHPEISNVNNLRGERHRMAYIASYFLLIDYIAENNLFPSVTLYKDIDVEEKYIDFIVDIGNSKTTVLLKEGRNDCDFNKVFPFELRDWTNPIVDGNEPVLRKYSKPFDMRLVFRKAEFGQLEIEGSRQFVYPSLVRLGQEANDLIHSSNDKQLGEKTLSTYSSPKRYLWDTKPNKLEWRFLTLNEEEESILKLEGITNQLNSDGTFNKDGKGGSTYHYSRQSLMTFAFLEMLAQAIIQINSEEYRKSQDDLKTPRRLKRMIITCPTTMSEIERRALVKCAKDAASMMRNFNGMQEWVDKMEIVPVYPPIGEEEKIWYYDEATCSQLVFMYSEIGNNYKGKCAEFFNLYGKVIDGKPQLTVGSLDIGAGTSDLMICNYTFKEDSATTLVPDPIFYDSFYQAGDDMLKDLVRDVMMSETDSDIRSMCKQMSDSQYHQLLKNFFGPDYAGQTVRQRKLRRDFNIQVSVPLLYYYLELLNNKSNNCKIHYKDVFKDNEPSEQVLACFQEAFGCDFKQIIWTYDKDRISRVIKRSLDPLLKQIAAIMFNKSCDVVILSGRPSSLEPIRQLFLSYFPVSPNRLVSLNDFYVGDWFPSWNNSGYITNPKTIVAVGAIIGYYSSGHHALMDLSIDTSLLSNKLKSTVNYVLSPTRNDGDEAYCLTESKHDSEIRIDNLPLHLKVRQVDFPTYPARPLFVINYNRTIIESAIKKNNPDASEAMVQKLVDKKIDEIQTRIPFTISLSRDTDNKESIDLLDGTGSEKDVEISVQSLSSDEGYWLDTGIFEF